MSLFIDVILNANARCIEQKRLFIYRKYSCLHPFVPILTQEAMQLEPGAILYILVSTAGKETVKNESGT